MKVLRPPVKKEETRAYNSDQGDSRWPIIKRPVEFLVYDALTTVLGNLAPGDFISENVFGIGLFFLLYVLLGYWIDQRSSKQIRGSNSTQSEKSPSHGNNYTS